MQGRKADGHPHHPREERPGHLVPRGPARARGVRMYVCVYVCMYVCRHACKQAGAPASAAALPAASGASLPFVRRAGPLQRGLILVTEHIPS